MARYCGDRNSKRLIEVAKYFKENCLLSGKSLFTNKIIWSEEYCKELNNYFVENLDEGEGDFLTKLETQIDPVSSYAKVLAAEMLWLMFLCPNSTGVDSKRSTIERVFYWSGFEFIDDAKEKYLSKEALTGIGKTGAAYQTGRWRELVYFIRLSGKLLKLNKNERTELLGSRINFSKWLNDIPENNKRQFRHMILYLFYPDEQERIFSGGHRKSLVETFGGVTSAQFNRMEPFEVDNQLLQIRTRFEQEYKTKDLDYYVDPLKSRWDLNTKAKSVSVKNTQEINKDQKMTSLNQILYGPPGTGKTYSTINKALEILDPEFLSENIDNRNNLKARFDSLLKSNRVGFVTFHQSFSYEDFVEGIKANTEDGKVHYSIEDGIFKNMCQAASVKIKTSSDVIDIDVAKRKIWKMSLGDTLSEEAYIYQQCIESDYVVLGYGYKLDFSSANTRVEVMNIYNENGAEIKNASRDYNVTSVYNFKSEMSIGDLIIVSDGNHKFRAIAEITSEYYFDDVVPDSNGYAQCRKVKWHKIFSQSVPKDELLNSNFSQMTLYRLRPPVIDLDRLQNMINNDKSINTNRLSVGSDILGYRVLSLNSQIIELKKPNGGSLPLPRSIIDELTELVSKSEITINDIKQKKVFDKIDSKLEKYIVNGYQNILASIVSEIIKNGIVMDNLSVQDKRVLIIDEINRGNISNIFGELITLIEPSKRAGGSESLSVKLPYSKTAFSVPSNLHIIGTMNTADKSLAQVDIALRRRFEFIEMMPDYSLLKNISDIEGINVAQLLKVINQRIELLYDREHTIGHSFFLSLKETPTIFNLSQIFEFQILPLLEEYFFEDWERVGQVLGDHLKDDSELCFIVEQFDEVNISELMGEGWESTGVPPYCRNNKALRNPKAYIGIYGG